MLQGPRWLKRLSIAWMPQSVRLLGDVVPVQIVNYDPGPFSRMPLSRALLSTNIISAGGAGLNSITQVRVHPGYNCHVYWISTADAGTISIDTTDLTGGLTNEQDGTEVWADEPWPETSGVTIINGSIATASIPAGRVLSLPTNINIPFAFGSGPIVGVPWLLVRGGEFLHFSDNTANDATVHTMMIQVVKD